MHKKIVLSPQPQQFCAAGLIFFAENGQLQSSYLYFLGWVLRVIYHSNIFEKFRPPLFFQISELKLGHFCLIFSSPPYPSTLIVWVIKKNIPPVKKGLSFIIFLARPTGSKMVIFLLEKLALHKNGVEFCQQANGVIRTSPTAPIWYILFIF